jgi:hypothetical protein
MEPGRLICVRKYQGDPAAVAYVVAVSESAPARTVIQDRLGISPEHIADRQCKHSFDGRARLRARRVCPCR